LLAVESIMKMTKLISIGRPSRNCRIWKLKMMSMSKNPKKKNKKIITHSN